MPHGSKNWISSWRYSLSSVSLAVFRNHLLIVHIGFHVCTNSECAWQLFFSKGSQCDKLSVAKTNVHTDVHMHLSVQMVVLSAALRESLFLYISYTYIYRSRQRPHTQVISCPSMPSCACTDCLVRHLPNDVWVFYYDHWFPDVWWWDKWWGRWQWLAY